MSVLHELLLKWLSRCGLPHAHIPMLNFIYKNRVAKTRTIFHQGQSSPNLHDAKILGCKIESAASSQMFCLSVPFQSMWLIGDRFQIVELVPGRHHHHWLLSAMIHFLSGSSAAFTGAARTWECFVFLCQQLLPGMTHHWIHDELQYVPHFSPLGGPQRNPSKRLAARQLWHWVFIISATEKLEF